MTERVVSAWLSASRRVQLKHSQRVRRGSRKPDPGCATLTAADLLTLVQLRTACAHHILVTLCRLPSSVGILCRLFTGPEYSCEVQLFDQDNVTGWLLPLASAQVPGEFCRQQLAVPWNQAGDAPAAVAAAVGGAVAGANAVASANAASDGEAGAVCDDVWKHHRFQLCLDGNVRRSLTDNAGKLGFGSDWRYAVYDTWCLPQPDLLRYLVRYGRLRWRWVSDWDRSSSASRIGRRRVVHEPHTSVWTAARLGQRLGPIYWHPGPPWPWLCFQQPCDVVDETTASETEASATVVQVCCDALPARRS